VQTTPSVAPESRSTEFVPVSGGAETTSAEALLVVAYIVMWAVFFAFLLLTWRKLGRVDRRLGELQSSLSKAHSTER
jgi:hypothetical protein